MPSNYLLRVNGRYYFRIHIPLDLRRWFVGRREIKRSLKSGNLEFAKSSARHWVYRTERLFAQIRSGMLTNDRVRKLVADYFTHTLQETEDARISGVGVPADLEGHAEMVGIHETLLDEYRENLSLRKYEGVTRLVDAILEGAGIKFKKGSRNYEKLCRETLKCAIEADLPPSDRSEVC